MRKGIDCHIHTFYQRCANETMTIPNIVRKAEKLGLRKIAITDHLHDFGQLEAFRYIKKDIEAVRTEIEVFFGVELNFMSRGGEFAYNEKIHEEYGFEIVIGGIHSAYTDSENIEEILEIQHEHFMKTIQHPLIDVLVHPLWFPRHEIASRPPEFWEELILAVPDYYVDDWAGASISRGCAIEVNSHAIFYNPAFSDRFKLSYIDLLRRLAEKNVLFSTGSDAHDINTLGASDYAEGVLRGIGAGEDRIWKPVKADGA